MPLNQKKKIGPVSLSASINSNSYDGNATYNHPFDINGVHLTPSVGLGISGEVKNPFDFQIQESLGMQASGNLGNHQINLGSNYSHSKDSNNFTSSGAWQYNNDNSSIGLSGNYNLNNGVSSGSLQGTYQNRLQNGDTFNINGGVSLSPNNVGAQGTASYNWKKHNSELKMNVDSSGFKSDSWKTPAASLTFKKRF